MFNLIRIQFLKTISDRDKKKKQMRVRHRYAYIYVDGQKLSVEITF